MITAKFLGWQEGIEKGLEIPLFNIADTEGKLGGSTVSEKTLIELKIIVPAYPGYAEYLKEKEAR